MVLGKLPVLEYPVNLDYSRARASALAVGADRDCLDMCCSLIYHSHFSSLPLSGRRFDID